MKIYFNMEIRRSFTRHEKIGNTIFPVTYCDNGMVLIDYPDYNPELAEKITEAGRDALEKISEMMKKYNVTIQLGNTEKTINDEEEKS